MCWVVMLCCVVVLCVVVLCGVVLCGVVLGVTKKENRVGSGTSKELSMK